jgi:uncharacterized membrane protein
MRFLFFQSGFICHRSAPDSLVTFAKAVAQQADHVLRQYGGVVLLGPMPRHELAG